MSATGGPAEQYVDVVGIYEAVLQDSIKLQKQLMDRLESLERENTALHAELETSRCQEELARSEAARLRERVESLDRNVPLKVNAAVRSSRENLKECDRVQQLLQAQAASSERDEELLKQRDTKIKELRQQLRQARVEHTTAVRDLKMKHQQEIFIVQKMQPRG
mmetsp:Transcript_53841/g.117104  ORF Transcript_53841/g.117104 Transcript_53841/m.117104 type:complete len:164 (-) Transcript_53841:61-552(-)